MATRSPLIPPATVVITAKSGVRLTVSVELLEPVPVELDGAVPVWLWLPVPVELLEPVPVELDDAVPVWVWLPVPVELLEPVPVELDDAVPVWLPVPVEGARVIVRVV